MQTKLDNLKKQVHLSNCIDILMKQSLKLMDMVNANQKAQFVIAHENWVESIQNQMSEIKMGLKGYKYLDEALELATELGLTIQDSEIIRTDSMGLTIFNPKNLADRIKGMKNKVKQTREEKIAIAKMQSQAVN